MLISGLREAVQEHPKVHVPLSSRARELQGEMSCGAVQLERYATRLHETSSADKASARAERRRVGGVDRKNLRADAGVRLTLRSFNSVFKSEMKNTL